MLTALKLQGQHDSAFRPWGRGKQAFSYSAVGTQSRATTLEKDTPQSDTHLPFHLAIPLVLCREDTLPVAVTHTGKGKEARARVCTEALFPGVNGHEQPTLAHRPDPHTHTATCHAAVHTESLPWGCHTHCLVRKRHGGKTSVYPSCKEGRGENGTLSAPVWNTRRRDGAEAAGWVCAGNGGQHQAGTDGEGVSLLQVFVSL